METITTVSELRRALARVRLGAKRVGFVPTMGFLHDGHLALIKASRAACDVTVVSIFVNPIQHELNEDLREYPRDFPRDEKLCGDAGAAILFAPSVQEVYPAQFQTFVEPGDLAKPLYGALSSRYFRGVVTILGKLFNMVQPDLAFFGQKDFQQCAVVQRMVADLNHPIEIVTVPTVREADGLAMSSRNCHLNDEERPRALSISRGLFAAEAEFRAGERNTEKLLAIAKWHLQQVDRLQYLELVDADTLKPAASPLSRPAALCALAYVGSKPLVDTVILQPK